MIFAQAVLTLKPRPRGFHLVSQEVFEALPDLSRMTMGMLQLFIQHTSASLSLNENADPDVRVDMETWANRAVPDGAPYFVHTEEGADDMPAHLKCSLFGPSVLIPIRQGRPALGTWQGVYLGEHRDHGGARHIVATAWGQKS